MPTATTDRLTAEEAGVLLRAAAAGDQAAWEGLVNGYSRLVSSAVRQFRLGESDVTDIVQTTWLRCVQYIDRIADPECVGAWLVTTARREALRVVEQRKRVIPTPDDGVLDGRVAMTIDMTSSLVARDRRASVNRLLAQLPPRYRQLLTLLMSDPAPSYEQISEMLDMPIGSIGPTRGRCLKKLAVLADEMGIELTELASA